MDSYSDDHPNGKQAEELARSISVPHGILERAKKLWKEENPDKAYGGSYHAMDPRTHFQQKLGLVISTSISSHLLCAYSKIYSVPPISCQENSTCKYDNFCHKIRRHVLDALNIFPPFVLLMQTVANKIIPSPLISPIWHTVTSVTSHASFK